MRTVLPQTPKKCRAIGMIHVHSTSAILNHNMTHVMDIKAPTPQETLRFQEIVQDSFEPALQNILKSNALLRHATEGHPCKSLIFLSKAKCDGVADALAVIEVMPFVKCLVDRALDETRILVSKGIDCIEVENIAAPYFVGAANGGVPWEEVVVEYIVAHKIRQQFPTLAMGVHILSCDELEALPIAICVGAFFIRSEATLFAGLRPEGRVQNDGNLARFLYMRRVCRQIFFHDEIGEGGASSPAELQFPQIWSDLHKKHTHFESSVDCMTPWLENIGFCKLEGCIMTGHHTGSDVNIADLGAARTAIDEYKKYVRERMLPHSASVRAIDQVVAPGAPFLPLVTGSGAKFKEYAATGADFIIVGTALKKGLFWENHVDPDAVEKVLSQIAEGEKERV